MNEKLQELSSNQNLVFAVFVFLAFSLSWSTVKIIQRNYDLQRDVDVLAQEVDLLQIENENLRLGVDYFKSDEFLEIEARAKFNKVAAGENVLVLEKDGDGEQANLNNPNDKPDQKPQYQENYDQWMYFLFGREPIEETF